jgi:ABC-type Co2+ transport system permease subunit
MAHEKPKTVLDYAPPEPQPSLAERVMVVVARILMGITTFACSAVCLYQAHVVKMKPVATYLFAAFCMIICAGCISRKVTPIACRFVGFALFALGVWYTVSELMHPDHGGDQSGSPSVYQAFEFLFWYSLPGLVVFISAKKLDFWALSNEKDQGDISPPPSAHTQIRRLRC